MAGQLLRQVALVSESARVRPRQLACVSAALQKQATRDLALVWGTEATVDVFDRLEDVPLGYWPMIIMDDIQQQGAAGIHLDEDGQPFALITASDRQDVWSLTSSHELLEMLVDPFGNRQVAGDSPKPSQGRVLFLVEVCDPSESAEFAYTVNGVLVSDFYTPRFFDPFAAPGVRYSFTGALREPRQVLPGGYLSWRDPMSDHWWQETWFGGSRPVFRDIGRLSAREGSIRSQIDRLTATPMMEAVAPGLQAAMAAGLPQAQSEAPNTARADKLRRQIATLTGAAPAGRAAARTRRPAAQDEAWAADWQPPSAAAGQEAAAERADREDRPRGAPRVQHPARAAE